MGGGAQVKVRDRGIVWFDWYFTFYLFNMRVLFKRWGDYWIIRELMC